MKTKFLFAGLCLALVMIVKIMGQSSKTPPAQSGETVGRYVFGKPNQFTWEGYVLDTATGRLWILAPANGSSTCLTPVTYRWLASAFKPNNPAHISIVPPDSSAEL